MDKRFCLATILAIVMVICIVLAGCAPQKYTVEFDPNGGVGSVVSQTFEVGVEAELTGNTFTKQNNDFLGWSTDKDATTATYTDKQKVKDLGAADETIKLFAIWKAHTYTVNFDANGGEGTMSTQQIAVGQAVALTQNAFTRSSYSFVGWALESSAQTADYTDGQSVVDLAQANGTVTLYAVWQKLVYTVKFDGNGATSGTMYDQNIASGKATALAENTFSRGYKYDFLGWSTDKDAATAMYADKQSVTDLVQTGQTVTLYAIWGEWVVPSRAPQSATTLIIEDVNNKGNSDLQADWEVRSYNGGWKETSATIQLAASYDGTNGAKLAYWDNTVDYRYGLSYSTTSDYDTIAFDFKGNGISEVRISLAHATHGVYMTYSLGTAPAVWTHYEISIFDEGWTIDYGGKKISVEEGLKVMDLTGHYDVMKWFDTFRITLKGNTSNGANAYAYLDNVNFKQTLATESTNSAILYDFGGTYTTALESGLVVKAELSNNVITFATLNLQQNTTFATGYQQQGTTLTFSGTFAGQATISGNGEKFTIESIDLTQLAVLQGATFTKVYVVDNFESYSETGIGADTSNADLTNVSGLRGAYYSEYYTDNSATTAPIGGQKWSLMDSATNYVELSSTAHSGNNSLKVVSLHTGNARYISMDMVTGGAQAIGKGTTLGFWVKNTSAGEIKIRNVLASYRDTLNKDNIQSTSSAIFSVAKSFTIPANSDWTLCEVTIDSTKDVYGIVLVLQENYSAARYLLVDDIMVYSASPFATYVDPSDQPQMPEFANISLDYQALSSGTDYNGEDWTRESLSSTGWQVISGQMRVRQNVSGNNVLNMYTGNQVAYRYSYVGEGVGLGKANYFSIDLGNYYNNPQDVKFKIYLIDNEGVVHYLYGGAESYEVLTPTNTDGQNNLTTFEKSFDQITVLRLIVEIKGTTAGDQYVYMDNVKLLNK